MNVYVYYKNKLSCVANEVTISSKKHNTFRCRTFSSLQSWYLSSFRLIRYDHSRNKESPRMDNRIHTAHEFDQVKAEIYSRLKFYKIPVTYLCYITV